MNRGTCLLLMLVISFIVGPAATQAQEKADSGKEIYSTAVLAFSEKGTGVKGQGSQVADLLAALIDSPKVWMVERAEMDKILKEAELSLSGNVNPAEATKVGQLIGAKIMITGSVFKIKNKTILVAKVIGTETSSVKAKTVKGAESIDDLAEKLAQKISAAIDKDAKNLMPKIKSQKDIIAELKKQLGDGPKPKLFVKVKERHIAQVTIDPAVETEIQVIAKAVGFPMVDNEDDADVVIKGEAFSEFAARRGNLVSVKARAEIKATDKDNKVVAVDRQTTIEVGLAEQIAGKTALQKAGAKIADRLLPKLVKK